MRFIKFDNKFFGVGFGNVGRVSAWIGQNDIDIADDPGSDVVDGFDPSLFAQYEVYL